MPGYCVIPSCKNRGGFSFPKDEAVRAKWVAAIKRRNWTPSPYSIVCHSHFVETDFHFYEGNVTLDGVPRRYQTLKKGVVPSIFPWSKPKSEAAILRDRRQSRRDAEDADRQMKRRQELREAGITPSSPLWKPGLLGAIKFKTMPREIKTPARYATEDAPSTSKPKRGRPPSSASKVKSTPSPSRSSAKKVIDSIIIGDDDSDVEILDTPPSRKRKSADDNDPDWGSGRKVSRSKRGSQDRRTRESTRTAATPPSPGVAAVAKQVAAAAKQVAAPKSKQNTSVKQTPSPKGLPKASPKITVKTSVVQNRPKTVITKLSHWETPAVNAIDLCMECKEEPLSPAQMKAMANEKAQYDKSQNLVKAAREGRLVFLPGGETKILDKPFSMVYTPQTPPAPVIPPPVLSPAPVPVSMMPKSLLIPGPMGRSNSPDLMIVAETPPRLTAQVMQLTPNINTVSRPATATTHTAPNAIKLVHGTCGLGIRLPPGWEPLPTAPAPVAKTPTPPKASTPKVQQVTPKAMTTARAKAQSEALAFLRQQMQQEAQAKAESETQKKKAKKIAQLEGDESGNWVPLDEYYYGKMEGNPTYSELKGEHRFKCWYCNKMLYNNVAAMMHIQGHIDSERQVNLDLSDLTQCKHCYKQFDTPFEMQTHIEKVHMNNTNVLLCRICEKDHDSRQGLTDHMRRCHNACEMPYICQLCKFRSSMYSDVVDHFKKKHNSSESMLCLYCLRVFHIRFVSQGWGQTSVYYNHLMKHQVKNSCKKCALCKLIFLNPADLKAHRKADHEANQKGVIGMNAKYTTPDQVMIKVTEKGPNMKAGGGVKSLNVPAVKKIMEHRLSFPSEVYKVKCIECKMLMGIPDHYKKFIQCSMCRFATSCSFAYSNHMMGFHSGQLTAAASHTPNEEKLENQLYCSCGFTSSYGNKLANHLVACSKSSCYKDPPPPSAGDEFGQELQDPRKKPDASLLDILGLVKKDSLPTSSGKSIRHESPPPEPVDMPDVEMSDRPARRPSLLKDSMKKSFKTILKDEKDLEPPQEIRHIDDKKSSTENRRDSSAETKMEDDSETKTKGKEDSKTEMKDDLKKEETDAGNQKKEDDAKLAKEGEESKKDTKEDSKEGKEEINNEKKEADFDSKQDVQENAEEGKRDADIENKEDDDKSSNLNAEGKVEGTKEDEQKEENREIKDNEAEVKTEENKDTMDVEDKKTEEKMEEDIGNEVAKEQDDTDESVRVPEVEKSLEDSEMKEIESEKSSDVHKETREKNEEGDENVEKKGEEMVEESSGFANGSVSGKKTLGLGLDYGSSSENEDEEEKVNEGGEEKSEDIPEKTPAATEERSDLAVSSKEMTTTVDEKAEDDKEEDDVEEKRESVGGLVDYNDEEEKEEDSNKGNEGENNLAEKAEEFQSGIDNDDTSGQSAVAGMETQDNEEVEDKSTVDKKNDDEEEDIGDMDKEEKMTGLEEENIDDEELRYDTPVQDEVNDIKNIDENKEEERMDISEEKEDLSQSSSSSQKQQELKPDRQEGESLHKSTENTEESSESASTEALFSEPVAPRYDKPASRVLGKSVGDVWEGSSNARDWRESFSSQRTTTTSDDNLTTGPTVHDMLTAALPADDNNTTSSGEDNLMTAPPADVRLTEAGEKCSPSISQGSDGFSDLKTKEDQTQSSLNLISGYDNDDEAVDDGKGTEESPSDAKTSEMEQVKTQQSETGENTARAASVPYANDSCEGADNRDVMSSESGDRQREPSVSSSSQSQDRDRGQSNTRDRSRSRSRERQRDRRSRSRDRDRDRDRHRDRDRDRDRHRERRSRSRDRDRDRHRDRDRDRYYDRDRDRDRHRDRSRDRDRYRERDRSRERDRDRDRERDRDRDYRRYRDDRRYR